MNKTKTFSENIGSITRTTILTIAVLTLGLSLTIIEWRNTVDATFTEDQLRFEQETDKSLVNIQKQMGTYQQVLRGIKGLFLASNDVTRSEFKVYTKELDLEHTYPGILGVGFALLITPDERADHIASIRAEGFPSYTILPEGEREQYTSIIYIEPFSGNNLNAFGFDMYSEKVRRTTMDKSRVSNKLALSGKVSLVQDAERGPISGVLLYLPVYKNDDGKVSSTAEKLYGWVYAPFSMDILMEGILPDNLPIDISIYDSSEVDKQSLLYTTNKNVNASEQVAFKNIKQLVIAQRTWTIVFSASDEFAQAELENKGMAVLLLGSLFSVLISLVIWSLSTSKNRAEAKAELMNKELSETEFRWKSALSGAEHGVWDWDNLNNSVTFDTKWKSMLGYTDDEIKNEFSAWQRLVHPEDWGRAEVAIADFVSGKTNIYNLEQRLKAKDGQWLWILCRGDAVSWTEDGRVARSIGTHTDITEQKKLELALTESDQRFRGAFETAAMGIALVGLKGEWIEVNPSLLNMLQYSEEELLKLTFQDITHPEDLNLDLEHLTALMAREIKSYQMEKRYFCKDGSTVWAFLSVSMVVDGMGKPAHFVSQIENITVRKELQKQVLHQASHDELTGLPNRRFLKERLMRTYELSRRYKRPFALMYIDVDHFKLVNDEYGHDVGDDLLIWLASKLKSCLRATDTLARQGGDEFVLILSEIKSAEDATLIANNIFEAISDEFSNGILKRQVSLSIGIAVSNPESEDSIDELLRKADIALYQVKRAGRNAFKHYLDDDKDSS